MQKSYRFHILKVDNKFMRKDMRQSLNPWEKRLNIYTSGCDASKEDDYHYSYEPTPYDVLERLVESGYILPESTVLDYGCGKGRVGFFLNHRIACKVVGVDFDNRMYEAAQENLQNYKVRSERNEDRVLYKDVAESDGAIEFFCESAEKYEVKSADCFYFFNPFSVEILQSVIGKIIKSYYNQPREMKLLFYYPSDEYVSYLMTVPELCFVDEIDCSDLFVGYNQREKILVFEIL